MVYNLCIFREYNIVKNYPCTLTNSSSGRSISDETEFASLQLKY